jgi:hypothetical protein
MRFDEAIAAMMMDGKKIKRSCWNRWMSTASTDIHVLMYDVLADDWEVYEETKKPRLLAPALVCYCGQFQVSSNLYSSEMQARNELREMFIAWPAVANAEGFYSVEE